jgi:hypothetical protein
MAMQELRSIEKVNLREIWPHEEHNFTPWLAENLNELGEELGLTLESPRTEVEVGQYRLDIQSEEAEGGTVVIENQLGWTGHDHLGKLLTYAAGGEADYVVWVAAYFTAEHRAAIDWLNRLDSEKVWFFGVEVRAIRIGDSDPAPDFRVVAAPNKKWCGGSWEPVPLNSVGDGLGAEQPVL